MKRSSTSKPLLDVLIVEDDSVSRKAMAALMNRHGYVAEAVGSAEEGWAKVTQRGAPRILLVDMELPGMSGLDLIEKIEQSGRTVFPVLITAANMDRVDRFLDEHSVGYMQKPVDVNRLFRMLSELSIN